MNKEWAAEHQHRITAFGISKGIGNQLSQDRAEVAELKSELAA